jgi:hypothetical protein
MRAKINFDDNRGRKQTTQIRTGQRLVIGSSFSADIVLGNTLGVVSEHAELHLKPEGCSIRNLTGNAETVLVNGQATAKATLVDGDSVEIGNNRLEFSLEEAGGAGSASKAIAAAGATTAVAANASQHDVSANSSTVSQAQPDEEPAGPSIERHSKISILKIESFLESVYPLLESEENPRSCILVCNHKRAKTGDKPESVNYLENGPQQISEENDLYLTPIEGKADLEKSWQSVLGKDAGLIGILPSEKESLLKEKFLLLAAWFMIPSTLKFHLINGSPLLLDKIFGIFDFLVMSDTAGKSDLIITSDLSIDSFETFLEQIKGVSK